MRKQKITKLFDSYNKKYFDGTLPPYKIKTVKVIHRKPDLLGHCDIKKRIITIKQGLNQAEQKNFLLHEMIHAKVKTGWHRKRFLKYARKLDKQGAFKKPYY